MTIDYKSPNFEELRSQKLNIYLFGTPIKHSKAPLFQNSTYELLKLDWKYSLFESDDVPKFKKKLYASDCAGSAVTMPNKVLFADHVDIVDSQAKGVGAINTVYKRIDAETGKTLYIGTNTDTVGVRDAFLYNTPKDVESQEGKPGLVYGAGGASRSAVYALFTFLGCSKVYIINRLPERVEQLKMSMAAGGFKGEIIHVKSEQEARSLEDVGLIVLTVPDNEPQSKEEIIAKKTLDVFLKQKSKGAVLEMCYHPQPETRLYKEFAEHGWNVINGIEAMIYQGFAQQVLWTGYTLDQLPTQKTIETFYRACGFERK